MLTVRPQTSLDSELLAEIVRTRSRPAEVPVDNAGWRVVREREGLGDSWRGETVG